MNSRKAREIMKGNFFGVEEILGHLDLTLDSSLIPSLVQEIPFDEKDLKREKKNFFLMLIPPISIEMMQSRWDNLFLDPQTPPDMRIRGAFLKDLGEKASWYLIGKGALKNSYGKNWVEQRVAVCKERSKYKHMGEVVIPSARIVAFTMIAHYKAGIPLLMRGGYAVRTSSMDCCNRCVLVGTSTHWDSVVLGTDWGDEPKDGVSVTFVIKPHLKEESVLLL